MKPTSPSNFVKNAVSVVMGTLLAASIYANAVYVPQNQDVLKTQLGTEVAAVNSGDKVLVPASDGYVVRERLVQPEVQAVAREESDLAEQTERLMAEIAKLEQAMEKGESVEAASPEVAAYSSEGVERVAQTFQQIASTASQISTITGLPIGATIGSLSAILADPLLSAGAVEVITASTQPGGIAAAISNGGGLSAPAVAVLTLLGVQGGQMRGQSTAGLTLAQGVSNTGTGTNVSP